MGSGAKSYEYMRGSQYMRKCANFSSYMRRPSVIYDLAPDPSKFPYIGGKFFFLFYQYINAIFLNFFTDLVTERPWFH